jgi:hypothetical protein
MQNNFPSLRLNAEAPLFVPKLKPAPIKPSIPFPVPPEAIAKLLNAKAREFVPKAKSILMSKAHPVLNHNPPIEETKEVKEDKEKNIEVKSNTENATEEEIKEDNTEPKEEEIVENKVETVYPIAYLLQFRGKCQSRPKDMRPIEIPVKSNLNFKFDGYDERKHSETAEAIRNIRILLNKLAKDNFARVADSILNSDYDKEILSSLVSILFNKCVNEHRYIDLYMKLVDQLFLKFKQSSNTKSSPLNFKKQFIEKCQIIFEGGPDDFLKELPGDLDEEEKKQKKRQRMLGNTKLIGQLFIRGALTDVVVISCFQRLFKTPTEDSIENLCHLFLTIGKPLYEKYAADANQAMKPKKSKIRIKTLNKETFDDYVDRLIELKQTLDLATRLKFMIMDVIDDRTKEWNNAFDKFIVPADGKRVIVYHKKTKSIEKPEVVPAPESSLLFDSKLESHEMRKKSMNEQNVFGRNIERFKKTQIEERIRVIRYIY